MNEPLSKKIFYVENTQAVYACVCVCMDIDSATHVYMLSARTHPHSGAVNIGNNTNYQKYNVWHCVRSVFIVAETKPLYNICVCQIG